MSNDTDIPDTITSRRITRALLDLGDDTFKDSLARVWMECEHNFIPVNWRITETSKSASQLMCTKCLQLIDMVDISAISAKATRLGV